MRFFRTFCALIAGLTVLAAGVIYSTSAPRRYTATAAVRMAPSDAIGDGTVGPETLEVDALAERLATRENVLSALSAIDQQRGRKDNQVQAARREQLADALTTGMSTAAGGRQLTISYTGADALAATQVVNQVTRHIADQYADALLRWTQSNHEAAQLEVKRTRQALNEAQAALDSAIAAQLRIAQQMQTTIDDTSTGEREAHQGAKPEQNVPEENPVWTKLSRQLSTLEAELARRRETRTLIHPLVKAAQWQAEQLRGQLHETPRYLSNAPREGDAPNRPQPQVLTNQGDGRWTVAQPDVESAESGSGQTATGATIGPAQAAQKVAARRSELADAEARYESAVRAERSAWERLTAAQAALQDRVRVATAAESTTRHAIEPTLLAAAVAGLIVSLLIAAGARTKDRILTDVDEARRRLSMPVVGVISTT